MGLNFKKVIPEYVKKIDVTGDFLEIGSERGDNSTPFFGSLAKEYNKKLYSVDVDKEIIDRCRREYFIEMKLPIHFAQNTGERFLELHNHLKFSVVLLDNFDWTWRPNVEKPDKVTVEQTEKYKNTYGTELNNLNSQTAHLIQAIKLTNMLTDSAIIICDDTYLEINTNVYVGKCGAAIPYLLSLGFKIVYSENFGVILMRKKL